MLDEANSYLSKEFPQISSGLVTKANLELAPIAEKVLDYFALCNGNQRSRFESALGGVAQLSFDFIRLHGRFLRTGKYKATDSKAFEVQLYSQPDRMRDYLDGLLLSYALWPNHVKIYDFMLREFTEKTPINADVVEVGVGHGLMAATVMQKASQGHYFGFDLSQSSLDYCAAMLRASGIDERRFSMRLGNATHPDAFGGITSQSSKRRALCCEVLEHVEEPQKLLHAIREFIGAEGEAFVTTVANIDAEDHIFLYENADKIREMIQDCGLLISQDLSLVVPRYEENPVLPVNYAAILRVA
jgi:hypothetical protein